MAKFEPSIAQDEYYSSEDMDRLLAALERRIQAREVIRIEDAAIFLGVSKRTVDRMAKDSGLPHHRLPGLSGKVFLRSELIEYVKSH